MEKGSRTLEYSLANPIVFFSPFEGDVEFGVLAVLFASREVFGVKVLMLKFVRGYFPAILITLASVALFFSSVEVNQLLRFDQQQVASGELWRLLSSNLLHTNGYHLLLNLAALLVVASLFRDELNLASTLAFYVASMILTTLLLFCLSPEIHYYVGFSGALHSILVAYAIATLQRQIRFSSTVLLVIGIKITEEQINGSSPLIGQLIDSYVVVDAHMWGAFSGLILGLVYQLSLKKPG